MLYSFVQGYEPYMGELAGCFFLTHHTFSHVKVSSVSTLQWPNVLRILLKLYRKLTTALSTFV